CGGGGTPNVCGGGTGGGSMPPPPGYSSSQLIFEDQFAGTTLDLSKWVTYLGSNGAVWNGGGQVSLPLSAPTPGHFNMALHSPNQVPATDGCTLPAQRNPTRSPPPGPWISGIVPTEGKFSPPASGWYAQVKAQMPDQTQGMWAAIWFMPDTGKSPVP